MSNMTNAGVLLKPVFPSKQATVVALDDWDAPAGEGAHRYQITTCLGFENGETQYTEHTETLQFVHKYPNGVVEAGLQTEQILIALIDRHGKLHAKFPSPQNLECIAYLEKALASLEERVKLRMERGVMGELKL